MKKTHIRLRGLFLVFLGMGCCSPRAILLGDRSQTSEKVYTSPFREVRPEPVPLTNGGDRSNYGGNDPEGTRIWPSPFNGRNGFYLDDAQFSVEQNKGMIEWGDAQALKVEKDTSLPDNETEESHGSDIRLLLKQIPDHKELATHTCFKKRPVNYNDKIPLLDSEKCCIKLGVTLLLKKKILGILERNHHQFIELSEPISAYNPQCKESGFSENVGWIPSDHILLNEYNSVVANDVSESSVSRRGQPAVVKNPISQVSDSDGVSESVKGYDAAFGRKLAHMLDPSFYGTAPFVTTAPRVSCGGAMSRGKCHACVSQVLRKLGRWPVGFMGEAWPEARLFHDSLNSCGRKRLLNNRFIGGKCEKKLSKLGLKPIHDAMGYDLKGAPLGTILVWAHGRYGHIEVVTKTPSPKDPGRACSDYCSKPGDLRGKKKLLGMYMPAL